MNFNTFIDTVAAIEYCLHYLYWLDFSIYDAQNKTQSIMSFGKSLESSDVNIDQDYRTFSNQECGSRLNFAERAVLSWIITTHFYCEQETFLLTCTV